MTSAGAGALAPCIDPLIKELFSLTLFSLQIQRCRIEGSFFKLRCCFGFADAVMSSLFVASKLVTFACILLQVGSEAGARAGQVGRKLGRKAREHE